MKTSLTAAALTAALLVAAGPAAAELSPDNPYVDSRTVALSGNVLDQVDWGLTINDVLQRYLDAGKLQPIEERYAAENVGAGDSDKLEQAAEDKSRRPAKARTVRSKNYAECARFNVPIPEKVPHYFTLCAPEEGGEIAWFMIDTDMTPAKSWIAALSSRYELDIPWDAPAPKGFLRLKEVTVNGVPTQLKIYWENTERKDIPPDNHGPVYRSHLDISFTNLNMVDPNELPGQKAARNKQKPKDHPNPQAPAKSKTDQP